MPTPAEVAVADKLMAFVAGLPPEEPQAGPGDAAKDRRE